MKTFIAAAAIATTGFVGTASAADIPARMPLKAPPLVERSYDWTGFYLGGDVGWQRSSIGLSAIFAGAPAPLSYSPAHSSVAYGGFLGYQYQFGQWVLGVEGGYTAASGSGDLGAVPATTIFFPGGTGTASAKLKDIWNLGARAGFAVGSQGNWLPYLTGGYASGRFQFSGVTTGVAASESASTTAKGGYLGAGLDWALMTNSFLGGNVILGIEYRHYFFETATAQDALVNVAGNVLVNFKPKTDTVMARVSWKFGR
jgi:outer membrane immunogenic protein